MSERITTVEDALWAAQRNYGEDLDTCVLEGELERAGWSGPSVDFEHLVDGARAGYGNISAQMFADDLEGAGWRFDG